MNLGTVSVIIPIYNAEKYLDECLNSVVQQDYKNLEIICINDGSSDNSGEIIAKYTKKDSRIVSIKQSNQGVSFTKNQGIDKCKGEYLVFIDADDIVSSSFVSTLLNIIHSNCEMACVGIAPFSEKISASFSEGKIFYTTNPVLQLLGTAGGYMANKMYRVSLIKNNGIRLDTNIAVAEDLKFNIEYCRYVHQAGVYDGVKYLYRQHGGSAINALGNRKWYDILKVYDEIIQNLENTILRKEFISRLMFLLLEAEVRAKYVSDNEKIINMCRTLEKKYIDEAKKLPLIEKFKLRVYRLFPKIITTYKRRYLR